MSTSEDGVATLNFLAAVAARDAIESAAHRLERELLSKKAEGPHADYFNTMDKERKDAIGQLRHLAGRLNLRVFNALKSRASEPKEGA